jgi:hypothetical protein
VHGAIRQLGQVGPVRLADLAPGDRHRAEKPGDQTNEKDGRRNGDGHPRDDDNDTAFAQHGLLRTMRDMTTWFCDAYASWQKGGVENANGRLRRWLPRHLDIDRTSDQDIQEIVLTTNLTPRKCLGFKTPFQALLAELGKDVQIRFS